MVGRKIAASLLGGFRVVINDYDEEVAPCGLLLAQLLIYAIIPVTTVVGALAAKNDLVVGMVIGGAIACVINTIMMLISKMLKAPDDTETISCCSAGALLFLFPKKSSVFEMIYVALLTFVHGALMVYVVHPKGNGFGDGGMTDRIGHLVIMGLASYSLFSANCPEIAIYRDNDSELEVGSNHYQRAIYCSLIAVIMLIS